MERSLHLSVFKVSHESFLHELERFGVEHRIEPGMPEYPKAKGSTVWPSGSSDSVLPRIAQATSAWIKGGAERYVHATLWDNTMTDLTRLSAAELLEISDQIAQMSLIDMGNSQKSNNSFKPRSLRGRGVVR